MYKPRSARSTRSPVRDWLEPKPIKLPNSAKDFQAKNRPVAQIHPNKVSSCSEKALPHTVLRNTTHNSQSTGTKLGCSNGDKQSNNHVKKHSMIKTHHSSPATSSKVSSAPRNSRYTASNNTQFSLSNSTQININIPGNQGKASTPKARNVTTNQPQQQNNSKGNKANFTPQNAGMVQNHHKQKHHSSVKPKNTSSSGIKTGSNGQSKVTVIQKTIVINNYI